MDTISDLPDTLLLKILSSLPAKDVVATMVLSKRWQTLWMLVHKLEYDDSYQNPKYERFSQFVDRSLFLHEAPVIETLHFKLGKICGSGDIRVWIRAADKCLVHELIIDTSSSKIPVTLPRSLYSGGCTRVVTLKLSNAVLVDASSPISFPSLKNLSLISMTYPGGDEFVKRLLSSCPVLEDLVVKKYPDDNVDILNVRVPSLKSLFLYKLAHRLNKNKSHGFVIDAPSLECLDIVDYSRGFRIVENEFSKIVKANINILSPHTEQILGSITLAKRLILCLPRSEDAYPVDRVFYSLVHLKMCTCEIHWFNRLKLVLRDSPNLRALQLEQVHGFRDGEQRLCWSEPNSVPECLLTSLETVEWVKYNGTEEEKEVAAFILRSGSCLKKVSISSKSADRDKKHEMLKELALSYRRSPTCQLVFN
ncbi:PREDICTED: probable FBD-associated F-box protein At1g32375 [Camelina sativa]|uniref:Probable FBD-associated F-box protein At1g32375 n=1 Tax=Camelina sativa TaxID=90675 RepID=A0ABM0WV31_CAMSA|nr:PREDICTED: probable FBD-associated F-box protein At1g32375 [Camelina sativa]